MVIIDKDNPKILLVEGKKDLWVIPELIEATGVKWGERNEEKIVYINQFGGVEELLKPGTIEFHLKDPRRQIIGILIDADNYDIQTRWSQVRTHCLELFPNLRTEMPKDGLIEKNADGLKLGVWIMPDNEAEGMLETFLHLLVKNESDPVLLYAAEACREAKARGASYKDCHLKKAELHTWLAWQDEPGRQLHEAIRDKKIDPLKPAAQPFVAWFCNLFDLQKASITADNVSPPIRAIDLPPD